MRDGILHNYRLLSMGGSIPTASGGDMRWSRVRNRMTIAIRQSRGLGALFPILSLTGKLERGLAGGGTIHAGQSISYAPASDVRALVATHQLGLRPLPSLSGRSHRGGASRVPKREIIFWSREMARQIETLAAAMLKGARQ